ncbi:pyridoxal phosphate-dependent transferase [Mycotypha africana]|uniref:pyridoxal phosphate-dependent transferase n=1 Tax=Mycotypha africana TaxID=64632 RepID=UPI002300A9A9|nr:pyridoxal phosphate-dependent transferase [Mycotypha africana]KAI8979224.1 pyridoxal phosphate-dependent transferase [Mycotypha africana]
MSSAAEAHKQRYHLRDIAEQVQKKIIAEHQSEAHRTLRSYPGNENKAKASKEKGDIHGIEHPGSTGVIYVMDRASKMGYTATDKEWSNFGQGAPEVGPVEGCMERPKTIHLSEDSFEYANTSGVKELRETVANLYNEIYRKDKKSKYTYENVCIVPGGRAGLTRVASAIGDVNVGYFLPEYTAYEQMLSVFKRFVPIPTTLEEAARYHISPDTIRKEIAGRGIGVVVASNPRNPTGQVIQGEELEELVAIAKERHTTLVMDEFYSAYIYDEEPGKTVSISKYVEDVDEDPVILIDGLTKNFRMPGWRVCWIVGPKPVISSMESAGSFLEGGANHPLQLAAISMLDPQKFKDEAKALQRHFKGKRDYVLERLERMGLKVKVPPNATFYVWLDLSQLPEPINNGLTFFEECLKEKVIVVPGIFFDVNPSHRRELFESPCHHFVRLSFGPPMDHVKKGLDNIESLIKKFKQT